MLIPSVMNGVKYAAAVAASNSIKPSLDIMDIQLVLSEIACTKALMKRNGRCIYLNPPAGTAESITKNTILLRTMNAIKKKFENAPIKEIMENLKEGLVFFIPEHTDLE